MVEFELFIQGIDPVVKRMAKRGGKKKILYYIRGFGFWQATLLIMELQKIQNYRFFSLNYVRHFILNHFNSVVLIQI
jgi:hypothetical protein